MVVDEPGKSGGRMSVTFYQNQLPDDYFDNLDAWQDDFSWYQEYQKCESKWIFVAPSLARIAETVLTRTEFGDKERKVRKQLYAELFRLLQAEALFQSHTAGCKEPFRLPVILMPVIVPKMAMPNVK